MGNHPPRYSINAISPPTSAIEYGKDPELGAYNEL